jgi:hypothetical protein
MDKYQVTSLLMRLELRDADPMTVADLYAETLAEISECLTEDQMRRLLICGAYLCHGGDRVAGGPRTLDGATVSGRSTVELPPNDLVSH